MSLQAGILQTWDVKWEKRRGLEVGRYVTRRGLYVGFWGRGVREVDGLSVVVGVVLFLFLSLFVVSGCFRRYLL